MKALFALVIIVVAGPSMAATKAVSKYSSIDNCIEISSSEYEVESGMDYIESICAGVSGYNLYIVAGDARSQLEVQFNGGLRVPTLASTIADFGYFPNIAGSKVEWRGTNVKGKFVPSAIIYRVSSSDPEVIGKVNVGLAVIKISRLGSCQQAFVTGVKDLNTAARVEADKTLNGGGCEIVAE